ncbi:MAG: hypothetical protein WCH86_02285 [Kiritimatiellales bacterium]
MKFCYVERKFSSESERIIQIADDIITDYEARGYNLTLRQLYYQFVSKDLIENTERSYKRLGSIVNDGRLAGLLDWDSITDRTRVSSCINTYQNPREIMDIAARAYRQEVWGSQPCYVEVWVEKEALAEVIQRAANRLYVPWMSCRGYVSQSAMYVAARRFIGASHGRPCHLIHLGDHDPSGIDMTRDIKDRLVMFETEVTVSRIALNMDQVREYQPPPNPAKLTDSRVDSYISKFGKQSWELDALRPELLEEMITTEIESLMDMDSYERSMNQERRYRSEIKKAAERFGK